METIKSYLEGYYYNDDKLRGRKFKFPSFTNELFKKNNVNKDEYNKFIDIIKRNILENKNPFEDRKKNSQEYFEDVCRGFIDSRCCIQYDQDKGFYEITIPNISYIDEFISSLNIHCELIREYDDELEESIQESIQEECLQGESVQEKPIQESVQEKDRMKIYSKNLVKETILFRGTNCVDLIFKVFFPDKLYFPKNRSKYNDIINAFFQFSDSNNIRCGPQMKVVLRDTEAVMPKKLRATDIGYDLTIIKIDDINYDTGVIRYDTGVSISIDHGWYAQIVPRSSFR